MASQKSVLITGAAGGIGKALCSEFKDAGYLVVATDVTDEGPADCNFYLKQDLEVFVNEVAKRASFCAQVQKQIGNAGLDVLVNNAATQILGDSSRLSLKDWQKTLNVNLLAPFFMAQSFLESMEKKQGLILNISSIHENLTKPEFVAYATSKAALSGMTRSMAVDLGARVRVNAIAPAAIETDMLRAGFENNKEGYEQLKRFHPRGHIGSPQGVAKLAVMLADDSMSFMSGSVIGMDGAIASRLHDPS
ncbi:MAG: SDR family NAD(P)-dependent oxidoreductase [Pseudobdellovibrionaceae bacterium]